MINDEYNINYDYLLESVMQSLNEAYEKHAHFELLDVEKLVKRNNLNEVSNPIFFVRDNLPTSDGLLSNEIFGITKDERANIFAYIDLHEYFMHPLCYIIWNSMDRNLAKIIHGTAKFKIDSSGQFVEDENGNNGLKWLKENIDKIKFKRTDSDKRDVKIKFLNENKDKLFMKKQIVIPAYYRDINNTGGYVSVGEINKVYNSLILAVRSLKETEDYGLNMTNANRGRIQEIIVKLYSWFTGTSNDKEAGKGLSGKYGIIRRSILSKTTDYGTRLIISAPELKCESMDDMRTKIDYTCVPLASLCSNIFPFLVFYIRRYFENEFQNLSYPYRDRVTGELKQIKVKDPLISFSDERIKEEIQRFMKGFSNRFIPIEIPVADDSPFKPKKTVYMYLHGRESSTSEGDVDKDKASPLYNRRLTWCDLIYMGAVESVKEKHAVITRYPMDSYYNQFATKIEVSSTKETIPMYINNRFYKYYPKISEEDIGSDTSNKFIDTCNISNLHLESIGGDYDGDQITVRVAFTEEANQELEEFMNKKSYYINLGANNVKIPIHECVQALYSLTIKPKGYEKKNVKIVKKK